MAMLCAFIQATPQKRFGFDDFEKFGYKPKTSNPWNTDTRYRHNSFPYTKPNIGWNEGSHNNGQTPFPYSFRATSSANNWNGGTRNKQDLDLINRLRHDGIYVSRDCQPDPQTGTFENRFCHQNADCCYSLDYVHANPNPCKLFCDDEPGRSPMCRRTPFCRYSLLNRFTPHN